MTATHSSEICLLDGGLATELEQRGFCVDDPLWSARVLLESPEAVRQLHFDYLKSGSDCLITSTYQATVQGLVARGLSNRQAIDVLYRGISVAVDARSYWYSENPAPERNITIAASIGPYGAYLHDGSEYSGNYGKSVRELVDFHRPRFDLLAASQADWLAFETIPDVREVEALLRLLETAPARCGWFSFSCKDERSLCDGTSIEKAVQLMSKHPQVLAIGMNCCSPTVVSGLIERLMATSSKPVVVYPNSGEVWNSSIQRWEGQRDFDAFTEQTRQWIHQGARFVGGCCRTGPAHIRKLRRMIDEQI